MTVLVIAIAVVIALVVVTYAWGRRHPGPRVRRAEALRRRQKERDLI